MLLFYISEFHKEVTELSCLLTSSIYFCVNCNNVSNVAQVSVNWIPNAFFMIIIRPITKDVVGDGVLLWCEEQCREHTYSSEASF